MTEIKRMTMHRRSAFLVGVLPFIVGSSIAFVWQAMAQAPGQPRLPAPPRIFLNTTYTAPVGRTIAVVAGGDLQAALKAAQPGDVITLEPGAVFRGNFTLPKKAGEEWIVVRTATPDDKFAPQGARVTPAAAPLMPKIVSPNGGSAIAALPGAHHYRFIGIEFTVAPDVKIIYAIVEFGGTQTTEADTPHHLIVDRSYVHGQPGQNSARGVLLNSASSAVIDSHISEIHGAGFDSQAVLGYNGPGPFKIVNNFLEGAAENIMFGGADPAIRGLVPSDIEIRGNHLFKPLGWFRDNNPSLAGVQWTIKNLLEFKNAQRVLVEGNLLENAGSALLLTPRNQSGGAPWSGVQDVLFRNNIVTNAGSGLVAIATDNERPSQPTKRIMIVNNLWFVASSFFDLGAGPPGFEDVVIDHNTAIPAGHHAYRIDTDAPPAIGRFQLTNNLMGFGAYGASFPKADGGRAKFLPSAIVAKNALVNIVDSADGQGVTRNRPPDIDQAMFSSFSNAAAAGINPNGTLTPRSPNRRAGLDGRDIGVDFDELQRAMSGRWGK